MSDVVLDASVLVAALSPREVHHALASELYHSHPESRPFLVPSLFRVEVISALARRGERDEFLGTMDALVSGPRFHSVELGDRLLERATEVARKAKLRAYDAVYVALSLARGATLFTLDTEVSSRALRAFPKARILPSPERRPSRGRSRSR